MSQSLLIATRNGVYHTVDGAEFDHVLDSGDTLRIDSLADEGEVFASSKKGLFRSRDGVDQWDHLAVPRTEVFSTTRNPAVPSLFAGTHPAHLYRSNDDGETWDELAGFQSLPTRDQWHTPRHRGAAHVRSLNTHPEEPNRIVAGVEVGGVQVSEDNGETWTSRRVYPEQKISLPDDIHHLLVLGADTYLISTGDGLYRTEDVGNSWERLATSAAQTYFRESFEHDGVLFAGVTDGPGKGHNWNGAALLESTDGGDSWISVPYPGETDELVLAFTAYGDRVVAGTDMGRVLIRHDGAWTTFGHLPARIRSLHAPGYP